MKRVTVAQINKAFEDRGVQERIARGKDHFYFFGGDAPNWAFTTVFVNKVSAFDVAGWMREHSRIRAMKRANLFPDYEKYIAESQK